VPLPDLKKVRKKEFENKGRVPFLERNGDLGQQKKPTKGLWKEWQTGQRRESLKRPTERPNLSGSGGEITIKFKKKRRGDDRLRAHKTWFGILNPGKDLCNKSFEARKRTIRNRGKEKIMEFTAGRRIRKSKKTNCFQDSEELEEEGGGGRIYSTDAQGMGKL